MAVLNKKCVEEGNSSATNRSFIARSLISKPTGNCETPGSLQLHGCVTMVRAQVDRVKREHGFVMKHALYITLHHFIWCLKSIHTQTDHWRRCEQKLKYVALSLLHSLCCHELLWVLQQNLIFNPFLLQMCAISLFLGLGLMFTTCGLRDADCKPKICVRIWSSQIATRKCLCKCFHDCAPIFMVCSKMTAWIPILSIKDIIPIL